MAEKSRYWMVTIQVENMKKAGLTDTEITDWDFVAKFFLNRWEASSSTRKGCVVVCRSANGLYHLHGALCGESTTRNAVAKLMYDSHVEPCRGGLKSLMNYILKNPPYDECGEVVLHEVGLQNIQVSQGHRSDLEAIEQMIKDGYTPSEIMDTKFSYRRYEKEIKSAYSARKLKEAPLRKENMCRVWHVGESGTGKSYYYDKLCATHGIEDIYFSGYTSTGWLDKYMEVGAPSILFMDEFKPSGSWQELLNILDVYTRKAIHCRYTDIYPLWTEVHITSIFPPEEIYQQMVKVENRKLDSYEQFLRRLDYIVYHYIENGAYKEYWMPAMHYKDYDDLKCNAMNNVYFARLAVEE